jgi:hypothetical protein
MRNRLIKRGSFLPHFLLDLPDKDLGLRGELEDGIIGLPLCHKIGGDILIRIAISVRTHHPDLLAP